MLNKKRDNSKKKDIINNIFIYIGLSKAHSEKIVNDIINILILSLSFNKKIKIKNFGTFELQKKNKRQGRNPKNNKKYSISERFVVSFKASSKFKAMVNKNV